MGWMGEGDSPDVEQGGAWNLPSQGNKGFDWASGFSNLGKGVLNEFLPSLASTGAGMLINKMIPGQAQKNTLMDTRTPEQQQAAQFGMSRVNNLTQNPSSFGLPGDPSDINTPAGRKTWDIKNNARSADAARGMFTTGGSAQRETDALNRAIGSEFNTNINSGLQAASGGYPEHLNQTPAKENPWAKLLAGALDPALRNNLTGLLSKWGLT